MLCNRFGQTNRQRLAGARTCSARVGGAWSAGALCLALFVCAAPANKVFAQVGRKKDASRTRTALIADPLAIPIVAGVPREDLRYEGKSFDEWLQALKVELSDEARQHALLAVLAFAKNGYQAETIAAVRPTFLAPDASRGVGDLMESVLVVCQAAALPTVLEGLASEDPMVRTRA